jgi:hypothetical protein
MKIRCLLFFALTGFDLTKAKTARFTKTDSYYESFPEPGSQIDENCHRRRRILPASPG